MLFFFFFFLFFCLCCPLKIPKSPFRPAARGFPTVWNLLFLHDSLPRTGLHLELFCLTFCLYILSYLLSKRMGFLSGAWCPLPAFRSCSVEVAQHSNDLLMNLWGRKWSPCLIPSPCLERRAWFPFNPCSPTWVGNLEIF